ncbi:MAG: DUF5723 family protein [Bacteroidota bacterium]
MKKGLLLITAIGGTMAANAQYEYSSFTSTGRGGATTFATDYQACGINPANLGWASQFEDKHFTMGFSEMTYSIHSEALSKQELRDEFRNMIKGGNTSDFTHAEKVAAGRDFADKGFAFNMDAGSVGFSYANEKLGGIALRVNDRMQWYSKFGPQASEILFEGFTASYFDSLVLANGSVIYNDSSLNYDSIMNSSNPIVLGRTNSAKLISQIMDGSTIQMNWVREFNLSWGRKIVGVDSVLEIFAGIGVKYFQGLAMVDITSKDGQMTSFSSMSPVFDIDYGSAAQGNPSAMTGTGMKPCGNGFGLDLGINILLFNKLKIGAAVTNIGSITWDGNVYEMKDTLLFDTDNEGLNNYNIFSQLSDIAGDQGLMKWNGVASRKVALPTTVRAGASLQIGKKVQLGVDAILPTNEVPGSYENAIIGFGGDVAPAPWVRFSAGFLTGGNYGFQVPVGVTFIGGDGRWEGGVASRDVVTFFTQNGPTLSLSIGFLRFRF